MINESMLLSTFYYCLMQNVNYGEAFLYFYNITNNHKDIYKMKTSSK